MATYDGNGRQIPDPRPVEVPVGFQRPPTLQEEIRRFIRVEMSQRAQSQELESFEEADDFEIDDEVEEFTSAYEVMELRPEAGDVDASNLPAPNGAGSKARAPARSDTPGQKEDEMSGSDKGREGGTLSKS